MTDTKVDTKVKKFHIEFYTRSIHACHVFKFIMHFTSLNHIITKIVLT